MGKFDWPGWLIEDNPHGEDFDLAARKRMVAGSRMLLPFLRKHKSEMGSVILEVGPFFNPLVTPEEFPDSKIIYWENDRHVLKYLDSKYGDSVASIFCDLNGIEGDSLLRLRTETQKRFKKRISFDSVVVSHVLNYVDYKLFLMVLKEFVKKDGLVFINNVVDYGLPAFFSEKRPKSIPDIIKTVRETGYEIVEKAVFESLDKKHQKNERLILVAKSNS